MAIERFEDIECWQLARKAAKSIYTHAGKGPFSKDRALRDQITRAGGSMMHNIAEGFDSGSTPEFIRFLQYAKRSCTEVQSQLYLALDQSYITGAEFNQLYEQVRITRAKTGAFIKYLTQRLAKQRGSA